MFDVVNSYKGVRHGFGLPVHGQRTWSNSWSCYRSNLLLRQFKIALSKKLYTSITLSDLNMAYLAEQMNNLWKIQWDKEWKKAKKQRLGSNSKNPYNRYKVDLVALALGNVSKKKKKGQVGYTIGFDPGFTKFVFQEALKVKKNLKKANKLH